MNIITIPTLILALLITANIHAAAVINSKHAIKSPHYTGQTGAAKIHYTGLDDWLKHRADDDLPKDIYNRGFIIDDPKVVKPLYDISNRLLKNWPGTLPKSAIFVRVDTKSSVYGAEALIANEVLIYYGTLNNVESDDELAAIIAHELAHILLGHNAKANYFNVALQLFNDYEGMKNLRDTVRAGHVVETGEKKYTLTFDASLQNDIIKAGEQKKQASELYQVYHSSLLGRPAESAADLLAADLLIAAGYSPIGLHDTLGKLGRSYTIEKFISHSLAESSDEVMNAVKLSMDDQVKAFGTQLQNANTNGEVDFNGLASFSNFSTLTSGLSQRLKTTAMDFAWKRFKTSHPVPKKRVTKLVNYLDTHYGLRQRQKTKTTTFLSTYRRNGINTISSYKKIELASLQLIKGNIDKAASQSIGSLTSGADKDPYKRYTAHRIRRDQNQLSSAITNIERIDRYQSIPSYALVEMLDLLIDKQRLSSADKIIQRKEQYGYTVPQFYPAKIAIALARKNHDEALLAANQCINNKKIAKTIKKQCISFGLIADAAPTGAGAIFNGFKKATGSIGKTLNSGLNPSNK